MLKYSYNNHSNFFNCMMQFFTPPKVDPKLGTRILKDSQNTLRFVGVAMFTLPAIKIKDTQNI